MLASQALLSRNGTVYYGEGPAQRALNTVDLRMLRSKSKDLLINRRRTLISFSLSRRRAGLECIRFAAQSADL